MTYGDDSPPYQQLLTVTALASLAWKPLQGSRFDNEPPHIPFTVHETLEVESPDGEWLGVERADLGTLTAGWQPRDDDSEGG